MKAMHGPIEQNRTANGKVQLRNKVCLLCPTLTIPSEYAYLKSKYQDDLSKVYRGGGDGRI